MLSSHARGKTRLRGSTVVITGASSGIGRATALELARHGANVVAAARREDALGTLVDQCKSLGSRAIAVPTDVADEAQVDALARQAVERFGRIDVWVNNAGVYLAGAFEDVPSADFRQSIDVNLLGYAHGTRAALRQFRRQGRGVLINNVSIAGVLPMPYFSAYTTAKFGVLGLTLALRQELRGTGIEVCAVLPSSIDTPIFQHAGNYHGRPLRAMTPTYSSEAAARAIVGVAERPRRLTIVGGFGRLVAWLYPLMPWLFEHLSAGILRSQHFRGAAAQPPTSGNLFAPVSDGQEADGGWVREIGLLTRPTPSAETD